MKSARKASADVLTLPINKPIPMAIYTRISSVRPSAGRGTNLNRRNPDAAMSEISVAPQSKSPITYLWMKAALRSSLVASVEIMVVIFPTL